MIEEQDCKRLEIAKHNLQKIGLFCKVSTIIIVIMFLFNAILSNISLFKANEPFTLYFDFNFLIILFNLTILYLLKFLKLNVTKSNIGKVEKFINGYVTVLILIGAFVSLLDHELYNQLMIYTLLLLTCSSFFLLHSKQLVVTLIISIMVLLIGLFILGGNNPEFKHQVIYLLTLLPISYYVSKSHFYSYNRSLQLQTNLLREAEITRELTEKLREANRQLELQAALDPLTKLFNRRAFNDYIKEIKNKVNEEPVHLSAIMIDVDCFKLFNDTYGHIEGDIVLERIGKVFSNIADEYGCFVARWGGEEFAILMVNQTKEVADTLCQTVIKEVRNLGINHRTSHVDSVITVSIGAYSEKIMNESQILHCINQADLALYHVKENGRKSYIHLNNDFRFEGAYRKG
ncbi:GGDEF domain-containing protein [Ureibacillus sp. NPDC094379]